MSPLVAVQTLPPPIILFLSIEKESWFDESYARFIDTISSKATLKRTSKAEAAIRYLSANTPHAIIATDPGITRRGNAAVLESVMSYVKDGGTLIFGCTFSCFIGFPEFNRHFRERWVLPWEFGDYHRTIVHLNRSMSGVSKVDLPRSYSQKAVFLKNVAPRDALYLPSLNSVTDSLVFAPEPVKNLDQAPIAFTAIKKGWLGYVGDVNGEKGSDAAIIAMCGL